MFDENRQLLKEAPPSTPVLTVGWRELPNAGQECLQVNIPLYGKPHYIILYLSGLVCRLRVKLLHEI